MGDQWTFLLLLKPTQGHSVLRVSLSKQLITWSSSIISSAVTIERFLPFRLFFSTSCGRQAAALVAPAGLRGPTQLAQLHSVTLGLPRGCSARSYLGLCKAGVKHKALVNDQPQAYDCITLQWICSRWVEYYWWISPLQLKSCRLWWLRSNEPTGLWNNLVVYNQSVFLLTNVTWSRQVVVVGILAHCGKIQTWSQQI